MKAAMKTCPGCGEPLPATDPVAFFIRSGCAACTAMPYALCARCVESVLHGPATERQEILARVELALLEAEGNA